MSPLNKTQNWYLCTYMWACVTLGQTCRSHHI